MTPLAGRSVRGRAAFAVLLLALLAVLCTCKKSGDTNEPNRANRADDASAPTAAKPERIVLDGIEIRWAEQADTKSRHEIYPRVLAQALGRALTETDWFVATEADVPAGFVGVHARLELLVRYDIIAHRRGHSVLLSAVAAELHWRDAGSRIDIWERAILEQKVAKGEKNIAGEVALNMERAVAAVGVGLLAKEQLRASTDDEVIKRLADDTYGYRLWALEVVRHRRLRAGFDHVVAFLSHESSELRGAAVGALVAIGDVRAVPHLTKLSSVTDLDVLRSVIEAVSVLGGSEARDYLAYLSSGHPNADIRSLAADALKRVQAESSRRQ